MRVLFYVFSLIAFALVIASCNQQRERHTKKISDADLLLEAAHKAHHYDSLIILVDSFQATGALTDIKANYWLGYVFQRKGQQRMAEVYWKNAINDDSKDTASLDYYAKSASRLASLLLLKGDYEGTLKVALAAKSRMDELSLDTLCEYSNLLTTIGSCQLKLGNPRQAASTFEQSYQHYLQQLNKDVTGSLFKSVIVSQINTVNIYLSERDYDKAFLWTERFDSVLTLYENLPSADNNYTDKQKARLNFYRATVLQALGNPKEAGKAYQAALKTSYANTSDGHIEGSDYLMEAQRWTEAAKNLEDLDKQINRYGMALSLENIQKYYLPKFRANVGAHRKDSAIAVGTQICNALDNAITQSKKDEAAELATIYDTQQKEAQIARQEVALSRQRWVTTHIALGLIVLFFVIYTLYKRKAQKRLTAAHNQLQEAYDQLETTTKAKERIESELRIARDIQMSMLPQPLPDCQGIELFASMIPAKEVGGDLYDYLITDNHLYFCIGDVSGKGVPASLFMAQTIRLFRAMAKQHIMPANIATNLNNELTVGNDNGMFITMFIGLVDLNTGHLDFCNAGHNPPVLNDEYMEMESNAPIGLWPDLVFIGEEVSCIKGLPMFIYTDGLNEAENTYQEQFGDDRVMVILRQHRFGNAHKLIDYLVEEVGRHRGGAEPNDDLTMMCLVVE